MKIKHTQNNKNIKNQNNGTINNINIVAFGKEDLSKIENKEFFEALTQMGYKIPAKMFEKIHINDKYPEYKNIYISDINRGKAMVHDGKKWKLDKYKNIKHQNNGTINNINIVAFGKEDLSKIENKEFFEALTQMGYKIPAKMVEKIHINDKYPEYKNIYISDINRGKAMVHDGKKWNLERYDKISDKLLDKVLNFMEERYEELKDDKNITEKRKMNMENKLKILQIMKDYEDEEEKDRHEYLRSHCKEKIKMDLYNNRERIDEENVEER